MFFAPGLFPGKSVLAGVATRRAVVARGRAIIARVKIPGCSQEIRLAARRVTRPIGVSLLPDGDQKRVRADAADSAGLGVNPPNLKNWEKFQICCRARGFVPAARMVCGHPGTMAVIAQPGSGGRARQGRHYACPPANGSVRGSGRPDFLRRNHTLILSGEKQCV